jgi:hypothetical protein
MIAVYCSVRCWCGFLWSFKIEQPGRCSPLDLDLPSLYAGLLYLTLICRSLDGTVFHSVEILFPFTMLEGSIAHLHGVCSGFGLGLGGLFSFTVVHIRRDTRAMLKL